MDKNIYVLITEKRLLINAKRVEHHGLLLDRSRPLAQDLLLLLSLVSSLMICKIAVFFFSK
jgi:hypothetical protein